MNHLAPTEKVEAVLEVKIGSGADAKTSLIYASRINGNGSWRYKRNNGQQYRRDMDPRKLSENIVRAGIQKGYREYQVHYLWRPEKGLEEEGIVRIKKQNHKSYSQ